MSQSIPVRSALFIAIVASSAILTGCASTGGGSPTTVFGGGPIQCRRRVEANSTRT